MNLMHCIFYLSFFIALHSFSMYWGLRNLSMMVCLLVPIVLTYLLSFVLSFGYWHTLASLLAFLSTNNWKHTRDTFLLPAGSAASPALQWWAGWWTQCQCMLRVPEGAMFCFLAYADSQVSFLGLLLSCASSVVEMWDPVQRFSLW